MKDHSKKPEKEPRAAAEARLDEALEETFPASDPSSASPMSVGQPKRPRPAERRKGGK
jgi:hypothetical protein